MKNGDVAKLKTDYEFEAIDEDDNAIGMRTIRAGTECTINDAKELEHGWVDVSFSDGVWQEDWGVNDFLGVLAEELEVIKEVV
jgi:hypothetical protein